MKKDNRKAPKEENIKDTYLKGNPERRGLIHLVNLEKKRKIHLNSDDMVFLPDSFHITNPYNVCWPPDMDAMQL